MKKTTLLLLLVFFSFYLIIRAENPFVDEIKTVKFESTDTVGLNITSQIFPPEEVGMSSKKLERIDSIVDDGINHKAFPGCQILVVKDEKIIYNRSFGAYTYENSPKVNSATMYDLASLSKTTGTLLAVMKLYDEGKLKLTEKASYYLTFLRGTDKENITINELLFHESGLPASLPFHKLAIEKNNTLPFLSEAKVRTIRMASTAYKYKDNWVSPVLSGEYSLQVSDSFYVTNRLHEAAMQMIASTRLRTKSYVYSCVNFIVLKEIVETISGTQMDAFLNTEFYIPMQLKNMAYLPLKTHKKEDIAPTLKKDFLRNGLLQGYVHDPDAAFLGGVSGNAGLFATATDVATVYQMILNGGELNGKRYLSTETCTLFTTNTSLSGRRGLGFDKPTPDNPKHSPCCELAPSAVYGHTGYTGTCCWVDPVNKLVYVFLSNRTYPNDAVNKLANMRIRPKETVHETVSAT